MLSLFMEYKRNVSLAPFTTVKIGGPAEFCIEITSYRQFKAVLEELKNKKITILGNGSNVLISDKGLKDYVLINSTNKIKILKNYTGKLPELNRQDLQKTMQKLLIKNLKRF